MGNVASFLTETLNLGIFLVHPRQVSTKTYEDFAEVDNIFCPSYMCFFKNH